MQQKSDDARQQQLEETILSPITDPGVVEARKYFAMEYLRNLTQESPQVRPSAAPAPSSGMTVEERNAQAERILNNPDLRIPSGDEFLNLAQ